MNIPKVVDWLCVMLLIGWVIAEIFNVPRIDMDILRVITMYAFANLLYRYYL